MIQKLVNVYRGDLVESVHYGKIVVVNTDGETLASTGNKEMLTYWRSAAKPFQAMAVILSGAATEFQISEQELAVISSSHSGEEEHIKIVRGILKKIGLTENDLKCGIHPPYYKPAARSIYKRGIKPGPIYNNCSGKHAGILSICKKMGWDIEDYNNPEHPVQQLMLKIVADVTDYPKQKINIGIDGCGVVVFGLPLERMAYAFSRLANPDSLPEKYTEAARKIATAIRKHPYLIAGTNRFNTGLLELAGEKLIAKSGAEGIFCLGVYGDIGMAVKIADGNKRAVPPVIVETLSRLKVLNRGEIAELKEYHNPELRNNHRSVVGKIKPVFTFK
ncbi:MAG TPA: asparaginase [Halanaerobiales bacterium]|nr:asparaginase [Halanaerobiales bacterium]